MDKIRDKEWKQRKDAEYAAQEDGKAHRFTGQNNLAVVPGFLKPLLGRGFCSVFCICHGLQARQCAKYVKSLSLPDRKQGLKGQPQKGNPSQHL
ncbi:hypothetical protein Gbth_032_010 [Gluconobacter thailandicus F149-1 = NBRC 100600]|nr:hypothetical protein Gbth_032_010 [Gluconobacter thailandicus F149-1 = NBRC 100600]GBR61186.1 hypothetical protein AA100600_2558 [Gluconobacter thailandicus F149-1 = NBRC 100600]GEL88630.1 hypothetical protein GTH01_29880 [Gluconobacter thailandicus F149-1 = NBRC 100600]